MPMTQSPPGPATSLRFSGVLFVWRCLGVGVSLAAIVTGNWILMGMSLIVMLAVCSLHLQWRNSYLRNLDGLHRLKADSGDGEDDEGLPGVAVIVPARNEQTAIEAGVRSLLGLDYPRYEVLVVNDHSTDATPQILEAVAREHPGLRVLHDPPEQRNWLGKANAIWQGVHESDREHPWLVFTDADVRHHPKMLRRAMAYALREGVDYLTCVPPVDNQSIWEELTIPRGWGDIIAAAHYDRLNDPDTKPVGVGPFVLVRRKTYEDSGGHRVTCNRTPEDFSLAEHIKQWGGKMGVAWTRDLLQWRLYRGYAQLRSIFVRKGRLRYQDRTALFLSQIALTLLTDILPLCLFLAGILHQVAQGAVGVALSAASVMGFLGYYSGVRNLDRHGEVASMRTAIPWLHPCGGLLHIWFCIIAITQIVLRRPMDWRGRVLSRRGASS